ncbi:RNA polymerase ECF-type sigma factor [Aquipluma nitroreducens]|uniref:RNA polymerase ECF-type sigma factor n=1 Tax=Aquipluma nitroreducens TaxID=2010828 RepID=A0A5K7S580_9BACT|nr:sigma-70 family RNA polymerase sigma factor [Aquipluma nitroreducens]BBE16692.1 RNA polymerase ECF-type sigma factor [Aquipluma nitroreducens]
MSTTEKTDRFLSVVEINKGIIYKITNSYCKDTEDRKDLIQEIISQLWKSFDSYNDQYKYSTWIYRIALNVAISFYRKENRRKTISSPLSEGVFSYVDHHENSESESNLGFLQQLISELKDLDKALLLLYLEEKSHREIAEIIGISETNVATKIGRIKVLLKQKFSTLEKQ